MTEKDVAQEIVESDYKKYIPKECIKNHRYFAKKPVHNALTSIKSLGYDASYIKEQYLNQFVVMAPNYLCEEYKALMEQPSIPIPVLLKVNETEIKYCNLNENINDDAWKTLCAIEDLCFVSIRQIFF